MKKNKLDKKLIRNILNQKINMNDKLDILKKVDKNKKLKIWKNLYNTTNLKDLKDKVEIISLVETPNNISTSSIPNGGWLWLHEREYIGEDEYTNYEALDRVEEVSNELKDTILEEIN